jgi:hypothetical protein
VVLKLLELVYRRNVKKFRASE